jgi:RNA polymerase sigma factor (TIGR02999 family)
MRASDVDRGTSSGTITFSPITKIPVETAHDGSTAGAAIVDAGRSEVTRLLQRWIEGEREALDQIMPIVYERLRQLAHQRLRGAPGGASMNTTDLVHEAYLKLVDAPQLSLRDRSHFLALASRVMRNLLVDHARAHKAAKRGGGRTPVELERVIWIPDDKLEAVTELDEALERLEALDARQSRILELRYFGGLSLEETAEALGVSLATVKRELRSARAWLALELRGEPSL